MQEKRKQKRKRTVEEVIAAIAGSGGIKKIIATRLNVDRHTIDNYLAAYPSVAVAYRDEIDTIGDLAEITIIKAIKDGDLETSKWYARNKLKNRGYSERHEISEFKDMTDAQLIEAIKNATGVDLGADTRSQPAPTGKTTVH